MLLLVVPHPLQNCPNVELHTADIAYLKHKHTHKIVEHFAALLFEVDGLVVLQVFKDLVVGHRQLHHPIHLSF